MYPDIKINVTPEGFGRATIFVAEVMVNGRTFIGKVNKSIYSFLHTLFEWMHF